MDKLAGTGAMAAATILGSQRVPALLGATILVSAAIAAAPAHAQSSWTGTTSTDWFTGTNWTPNAVPGVGMDVTIDKQLPNATVVSGSSTAQLGLLTIGDINDGTVTVQNGGSLHSGNADMGLQVGSSGTVTVTGAGSTWIGGIGSLRVGGFGNGYLTIQNGGAVTSNAGQTSIGFGSGSNGIVVVDSGALNVSGQLIVGAAGHGIMKIQNGGTVSSFIADIGGS